PDERRRDRLPVVRHGRDDVHRKPVLARQPPHHLYVARAPAPEPMVVPQNQLLHPEARPQHVAHELLGSEPRQLRRERHHLDPLANTAPHPPPPSALPAGTGRPCTTAARPAWSSSRAGSSRTSSAGSRSACAATASGATASASRNGPTRVRLRLARCAPQPSASPTSRARLRRYVPPLTVARKPTSGGAKVSSSKDR